MDMKFLTIALCIFTTYFSHLAAYEAVLTLPKTGTNLVLKCVKLITGKTRHRHMWTIHKGASPDDTVFWAHEWRAEEGDYASIGPTKSKKALLEALDCKVIVSVRDPRDLLCALVRAKYGEVHPSHLASAIQNPGKILSRVCSNKFFLNYSSLSECFLEYLKWIKTPYVYLTCFENLVGPKGGGNRQKQIQEVLNISSFIGKEVSYERACAIADELFGNTSTFKQGQANSWQKAFTPSLLQLFQEKEALLPEVLGYL